MKNILLLIIPCVFLMLSCGETKKDEVSTVPEGMRMVDIKINGNDLSLFVPDSTKVKGQLQILEKPWGATEITIGDQFMISIEEDAGDIKLLKDDLAADDVYKVQKFIKDEPTLLFWEVKIPDVEGSNKFHFYNIIKIGNASYVVKDVENGEPNTQAIIELMMQSASTLKAKEASPAPES